jgi:hypothetical protein
MRARDTYSIMTRMTQAADDPVTTVKVPRSLRARIARDASANGQTAAGFLTTVIDRWEREQRLANVRRAYAARDEAYREETEAWDAARGDGLDG